MEPLEDLRTYTPAQPWDQDYWEVNKARGTAIRHHVLPRKALFVPAASDSPITLEEIQPSRTTTLVPYDKPGDKETNRDEWIGRESD